MTSSARPAVSIVVPVHDGTIPLLPRCLPSIVSRMTDGDELIIVDDGSTDDVRGAVAPFCEAAVHRLEKRSGPAAARNHGVANATRSVLLFVDADVMLRSDALERGLMRIADPAVAAVIGTYDDAPEAPSLVSRFKNLAHHYFHSKAAGEVSSFWGACGFVRRDVIVALGGFDAVRFGEPSIEDVELGWRMTDAGARIVLDPTVQVTHLKHWRLGSLLSTDVRRRAIPWIRLALERKRLPRELNIAPDQMLAAVAAVAIFLSAPAAIFNAWARIALAAAACVALFLNRRLFDLFWRKGGVQLLAAGAVLQQVYYIAAAGGAVAGLILHCVDRAFVPPPRADAAS